MSMSFSFLDPLKARPQAPEPKTRELLTVILSPADHLYALQLLIINRPVPTGVKEVCVLLLLT